MKQLQVRESRIVHQQTGIFAVSSVHSNGVQPNGSCCKKGLKVSCDSAVPASLEGRNSMESGTTPLTAE